MRSAIAILKLTCLIALCAAAAPGRAAPNEGSPEPAFFLSSMAGATYYESDLVQNNQLGRTDYFEVGSFSGPQRRTGIIIELEKGRYNFGFSKAKISTLKIDASARYYWNPIFAGVTANTSDLTVIAPPDSDGDGYLDINSATLSKTLLNSKNFGGIFGVNFDIDKSISVMTDLTLEKCVGLNEFYRADASAPASPARGARIENSLKLNVIGTLQITKKDFYFRVGYRYEELPVTIGNRKEIERRNTIYAGFRYGLPL